MCVQVRVAAIRAVRMLVPWNAHEVILNLTGFKDPNAIPVAEFYEPTVIVNYFGKLASDSSVKVRPSHVAGYQVTTLTARSLGSVVHVTCVPDGACMLV